MINPYTRQRVPEAPADKRVLYAEIVYPFTGKPSSLTFIPPQDEEGSTQVSIGFIAYHKSVPVIDFRYLGAPAQCDVERVAAVLGPLFADPAIAEWTIGAVRAAASDAGRDPDDITICVAAPAYVGDDRDAWKPYDATELIADAEERLPLLVDQGLADGFLEGMEVFLGGTWGTIESTYWDTRDSLGCIASKLT